MKTPEICLLEEKMIAIAHNYFLARRYLKYFDAISEDNFAILCSYISKVKRAFQKLNDDEKSFINNEYFYEAPFDWWKSIYSSNAYCRLKKSSIIHFLEVFHVRY